MTVNVEEINDFKDMPTADQDALLRDMENCEFVLNYFYKPPTSLSSKTIAHAIYVESYNVKKNWLKCVNSNGEIDQYPRVPIKDILNLYKVTCTAVMDKRENYGTGTAGTSQDAQVNISYYIFDRKRYINIHMFSPRLSLGLSPRLFSLTSRTVTPWTRTLR